MEVAGAVSLTLCVHNVLRAITYSQADAFHATLHAAHATPTHPAQAVHADFVLIHHPNVNHAPQATAHHAAFKTSAFNVTLCTTCKPALGHVSYSSPANLSKTVLVTQATSTIQSPLYTPQPPFYAEHVPPAVTSTHKPTHVNHAPFYAKPVRVLTAPPNAYPATRHMRG